ncbi:AAA family ATPase [Rudanella paleaurantiibacter]|uniref:AAA family ATPase n=1 Tax=Rudanella paleaurantiibacter TaxID=2614655 RepID=A0A7J5TVB1_9BACT|nr:MoxR family ATPase [Rudanella paleaurantiibacter]KAB7728089.1 AAA family ATPase [Rudanella paleaurantiibacter]
MFTGTDSYIATRELSTAVNAAVLLQKPLLIKGEPGTGKTLLAFEVARSLGKPLYTWHVKSTTSAQQGLYEYDAVSRLRDSQLADRGLESARINDLSNYIRKGKLWEAFESEEQAVLLIDEIDKADIEFPNDLLQELDRMEFYCYELQRTISARHRPVVIITSNNEKELPDAFLRRCFFHYIRFPDRETMEQIVAVHFPDLPQALLAKTLSAFYNIRDVKALKKKPSTSELIDWVRLLLASGVTHDDLTDLDTLTELPPYLGALLKNEQDSDLLGALKRKGARPY